MTTLLNLAKYYSNLKDKERDEHEMPEHMLSSIKVKFGRGNFQ